MAVAQHEAILLQTHQRVAHRTLAATEIGRQTELGKDDARPQFVENDAPLDGSVNGVPRT